MATLEKIRSKAGLLVVVIGVALLAFVLGDILRGNKSMLRGNQLTIAEVDDNELSVRDYQDKLDEVYEVYRMNKGELDDETAESLREQTWNDFIQAAVMQEEYDQYGIDISVAELKDMVQGENIHPIIQQVFGDPNTGQVNREAIRNFLANLDGQFAQQKPFWLYIEKEVVSKKKISKFNNLVRKALYVTKNEVEMKMQEKTPVVNFDFIVKKYNDVPDSMFTVSNSDLQNYYNEHKNEFKQEASRDIAYVSFDVTPSQDDNLDAQEWINGIVNEFTQSENDAQFVALNSDLPFDSKYYKKGELPTRLDTLMFDHEKGYVYGPYFENQSYILAKLSDIKQLPDSVRASHILIKYDQGDKAGYDAAHHTLDSLKNLAENGADFSELAKKFSQDGSAQNGGDLGWFTEGKMVKPFSDACFFNNKGDLLIVDSQFGTHLIQVTDQGPKVKKVQIATLNRKVVPSDKTYQNYYTQANEFAAKNNTVDKFNLAAEKLGRRVQTVTENQRQIPGMESPRPLIRWAFEANKNDVSQIFEFGNRFILATVVEIREKGIASLESKKAVIERAVLKEKKAEYLKKQFAEALAAGKSFDQIVNEYQATQDQASDITFSSFQIPNYGVEHRVIATAVALDANAVSEPIEGQNGVFVVRVTGKTEGEPGNAVVEKNRMQTNYTSRVDRMLYPAIKDLCEINDYRSKFE